MLGLGLSLWSSTILGRGADPYGVLGFRADLVLDFGTETYRTKGSPRTFDEAITYTGASNKTMVDSDGVLKWAPHNLLLYSNDFTQWLNFQSVDATEATSGVPDGSASSAYFYATSTIASIYRSLSLPVGTFTYSKFVKARGAQQWCYLQFNLGAGSLPVGKSTVWFDLVSGVKGTVSAGITDSSIESVGNGWYKLSATLPITAVAGTEVVGIGVSDSDNSETVTASTSNGAYIWGAHLYRSDLGGMVDNPDRGDSYVPTTTEAKYLPRRGHHVYNGSAWVNEGLLVESEARTNLVTYSNDFTQWTNDNSTDSVASGVNSPDGSENATQLVENGALNFHSIFLVFGAAAANWTSSIYIKQRDAGRYLQIRPYGVGTGIAWATFDPSDGSLYESGGANLVTTTSEAVGNGWYRVSLTCSSAMFSGDGIQVVLTDGTTGEGPSYTGDNTSGVYIYGAQLEVGSTPSSYIPTSGATVTRAAETLTVAAADLPYPTPRVIGPELVTNGTFDTDTSGWTDGSIGAGSIAFDAGTVLGTSAGISDLGIANQAITTVAGKVYELKVEITATTGALNGVRAGTTQNAFNLNFVNNLGVGAHTLKFVATGATTWISLRSYFGVGTTNWDNVSVREIDPLSVSIQMQGKMDYADTGIGFDTGAGPWGEVTLVNWRLNNDNYITTAITTATTQTGRPSFFQEAAGTTDFSIGADTYFSPGINVPFNIASRHGSTFINGAIDGTALTADTTPVALPDLSATNLQLAFDYMGTIRLYRMWGQDLGDTGIAAASAPSLEPSLSLLFDGSENSFTVADWSE